MVHGKQLASESPGGTVNNAHLPHGDLFCLYLDSCKVLAERETASQKEEICWLP